MLQQPRRPRYRKQHAPGALYRVGGHGGRGNLNRLVRGQYGVQAETSGYITARGVEALRRVVTRTARRQGRVWCRVALDVPVTHKASGARMGKGKGTVALWMARVPRGAVLFEMAGMPRATAQLAVARMGYKVGIPVRFVEARAPGASTTL